MRRFTQNRWLALILVLGFLLATPATFSFAGTDPIEVDGGGGSGSDPGGDPDGTGGGVKGGAGFGRATPGRYASIYAGDVDRSSSAWMWRLHVVLRSLTSRLFRF